MSRFAFVNLKQSSRVSVACVTASCFGFAGWERILSGCAAWICSGGLQQLSAYHFRNLGHYAGHSPNVAVGTLPEIV